MRTTPGCSGRCRKRASRSIILAGHGIGAGSAALAALDGAARLWDASGIWRSKTAAGLYGWRWPIRVATAISMVLLTTLLTPLAVLLVGLLVYLAGFLLEMLQIRAGATIVSVYSSWLQSAFAGPNLPTTVPRAATIALIVIIGVLATGGVLAGRYGGRPSRARRLVVAHRRVHRCPPTAHASGLRRRSGI